MAYSNGRGIGFQPIGYNSIIGLPEVKPALEAWERKLDLLLEEGRALRKGNQIFTNQDFPPLPTGSNPLLSWSTSQVPVPPPMVAMTHPDVSRPPPSWIAQAAPPPTTTTGYSHYYLQDIPLTNNIQQQAKITPLSEITFDLTLAKQWEREYFAKQRTQTTNSNQRNYLTNNTRNFQQNNSRTPLNQTNTNTTTHPTRPRNGTDACFRFLQVGHHRRNWNALPPSISKKIDDIAVDIHPPLPNDTLRQNLQAANVQYKTTIKNIVTEHLEDHLRQLEQTLQSADISEKTTAIQTAKSRILIQCNRINRPSLKTDIDRINAIYGIGQQQLHNDMEVNQPEIDIQTIDETVVKTVVNPVATPPCNRVAVELTQAQPPLLLTRTVPDIPTFNRFNALNTINTSSPNKRKQINSPNENSQNNTPSPQPQRLEKKVKHNTGPPQFTIHHNLPKDNDNSDVESSAFKNIITTHDKKNVVIDFAEENSVLILGDSNIRELDGDLFDGRTRIICIPGLNLTTAKNIVEKIKPQQKLTDIIIAVGINDRGNKNPPIEQLLYALNQLPSKKHFLEIGFEHDRFNTIERNNITYINTTAQKDKSVTFINTTYPIHTTLDGAHYHPDTNKRIFSILANHVRKNCTFLAPAKIPRQET
jgi:hypothetical protein